MLKIMLAQSTKAYVHTAVPKEKYRLTWDGKCKKFSVLFSLTQAQRGYSGFQVTGMIEWGQKSKSKKIPWASNKTAKNPWTKIYPPKNPMPNFRARFLHKMI